MKQNLYEKRMGSLRGQELKISSVLTEGLIGRKITTTTWKVTEIHQHFVTAVKVHENGYQEKQCFSVGDLVRIGAV